jgi:hypothetical protein
MKRVLTGTFLAATFAVGLSAQSPTPSSPPSTSPSSPSPSAQSPSYEPKDAAKGGVTVTGCLKAGDSADSFILSDLKFTDKKAPGAVGTSGSAPVPAAIASATTLKLNPGTAKLTDHIGHTVEVTGAVGAKADAGAATPPADAAASPRASASSGPSLDVKSVKMVSETCTPK